MIDIMKRTFIQYGDKDPYEGWCVKQGIYCKVENIILYNGIDRISNVNMVLTPEQATMFKLKFG